MSLPIPPSNSRWTVLHETDPGFFRVRCSCPEQTEKVLARRYVRGESLSCGCLVREKAAEVGRSRLDPLNKGYEAYKGSGRTGKFAPKLPDLETLQNLKSQGLTNKQIAEQYGASPEAVAKRLRKKVVNSDRPS